MRRANMFELQLLLIRPLPATRIYLLSLAPSVATYKKARGHPVKWLSTDLIYTKVNTWLCAMLSGTPWYRLEICG